MTSRNNLQALLQGTKSHCEFQSLVVVTVHVCIWPKYRQGDCVTRLQIYENPIDVTRYRDCLALKPDNDIPEEATVQWPESRSV